MYPGEHAKKRADEAALIMANSGEVVTFREFEAAANRMAHLYRAQGLRLKDHIALFFENNPRMLECEGGGEHVFHCCRLSRREGGAGRAALEARRILAEQGAHGQVRGVAFGQRLRETLHGVAQGIRVDGSGWRE